MIAKLQSISYFQNALSYCERGGEILASNNCLGNSAEISLQMEKNNSFNDKCVKNTFHIKIRIAPEDKGKINSKDWIDISNKYAEKIGFQKNPYAVYIHEEGSDKEHIHIVASRICKNNIAVKNNYTNYKSMDFCREIEKEYNLRQVKRALETIKNKEIFVKNNHSTLPLKEKINIAIKQSDSINDFVFHLENMGIKTKIGRGIGFTDEKGVYFKGSDIDRKYSLKGIEQLLSYNNQENEMHKQNSRLKM